MIATEDDYEDAFLNLFTTTDYILNLYHHKDFTVNAYCSKAASTDCDRTGTVLWPATHVLLEYLLLNITTVFSSCSKALELGAGIALPSLFVKKYCSVDHVFATDGEREIVDLISKNANVNCLSIESHILEWERDNANRFSLEYGKFDLVYGADVLYDPTCFTPLFETVEELITDDGEAVIAYKKRSNVAHELLFEALDRCLLHFSLLSFPEDCFIIILKKR
ncbi:hypothetical protein P9112_007672 [Eukaryota sp. TZLM1-RC]